MMKKFVLAMLCAACACTMFASEDNLVKDPKFTLKPKNFWLGVKKENVKNGVLKLTLSRKTRSGRDYIAAISQNLPAFAPGKYEFSGYYKGNFNALFLVLRTVNKAKKQKDVLVKWIPSSKFLKASDKPSWNKFFYTATVPAGTAKGSIHVEAFGAKDSVMEVCNIELMEAEE